LFNLAVLYESKSIVIKFTFQIFKVVLVGQGI